MKGQKHSVKKSQIIRTMAYRKTLRGLKDKLPIFAIAAIAGITLSILDKSKTNYETAKNTSIEVTDRFVDEAKSAPQGVWKNLNDPHYFKYRTFTNQRELLDALAARALAENAAKQTKLEAEKRALLDRIERERVDLKAKNDKAQTQLADLSKRRDKVSARSRAARDLDRELAATTKTIADNDSQLRNAEEEYQYKSAHNAAQMEERLQESRTDTGAIYNDFGVELPSIVLRVQNKPQGFLDILLKPILNERSSLYVIYQILRITALILLVLSFAFVLVMALRQLPLASGPDTVTEQLRGLIALKHGSGDMAKAAVLSVAALGVGTAAVVAGNSINEKADRALEIATASATPEFPINPHLRNAYYSGSHRFTLNETNNFDDRQPPLDPNPPNIMIPQPVVQILTVPDRAGTRALIAQLNAIGSRLPLSDVTALKTSVSDVQKDISTIKSGLGSFKDEASLVKTKLGDIDGSLKKISDDTVASSTAQNQRLSDTNDKLEVISNNIAGMRQDSLVRIPKSDGRNLSSRASQFFGSESFAVSEPAYQSLVRLLPNSADNRLILVGLEQLKYDFPSSKGTFLKKLRAATSNAAGTRADEALRTLKHWEPVILSYSRLPK